MKSKVYISRFEVNALRQAIQKSIFWIGHNKIVAADTRVFIKPNFTYPFYKAGVTTSPAMIEAVVSVLLDYTSHITIVESDGGAHAWTAEEAFVGHQVPEICQRFGIRAINLGKMASEVAQVEIAGRQVGVELPSPLLHDSDLLVTMPVPKVHVMTRVSLGFKNQWGCIPDTKRLRYHHDFKHVVLAINKLLRPNLAIFDGTFFLNRTGPMDGDPVPMNLLITSNNPSAGSLVCCEIMGIDPNRVKHLRLAMQEDMMPRSLAEIELNADPLQFNHQKFFLERTLMNWVALAAFHSRLATWLLYDSKFANPIHELLYLVRGRPKDFGPQW